MIMSFITSANPSRLWRALTLKESFSTFQTFLKDSISVCSRRIHGGAEKNRGRDCEIKKDLVQAK